MDATHAQELLASIDAGRLIILCGAGLSMPAPSLVPSAGQLAQHCAVICLQRTGHPVSAEIEGDLERLAEFFLLSPPLRTQFRDHFIDWRRFKGEPNKGHFAIADFLGCGAAEASITTNVDVLIEKAAERLGEPDFQAAIEGDEITRHHDHNPLLKIHGCLSRNRDEILWCHSQIQGGLRNDRLVSKLAEFEVWLRTRLRGRDLVIIGFWSDWAYLNDILESVVDGTEPALVYLVDPQPETLLEEKAPGLWTLAQKENVVFRHMPQSGDDFLAELRKLFSLNFFANLLREAIPSYKALVGDEREPLTALPNDLDPEQLYDLRRDLCGTPPRNVVRHKNPQDHMQTVGAIHLSLQNRGARFGGPRYVIADGRTIRVVNGAGQVLSRVKARFSQVQAQVPGEEIVICDAQGDGNVPSHLLRGKGTGTVVRSGTAAEWMTIDTARGRGLC